MITIGSAYRLQRLYRLHLWPSRVSGV